MQSLAQITARTLWKISAAWNCCVPSQKALCTTVLYGAHSRVYKSTVVKACTLAASWDLHCDKLVCLKKTAAAWQRHLVVMATSTVRTVQ